MSYKRCVTPLAIFGLVCAIAALFRLSANADIDPALQSGFNTLGIPAVSLEKTPAAPKVFDAQPAGPLILPTLWASLPRLQDYHSSDCSDCPDDWVKFSAERLPDVNPENMRVMTWDAVNDILSKAVDRKMFLMSIFTDNAFRTPQIYFIPQEVLTRVFKTFEMRIATNDHGTTKDKDAFVMCGMATGSGRLDILYCRPERKKPWDKFSFNHPELNYEFTVRPRITETIVSNSPEELRVEGLQVKGDIIKGDIFGMAIPSPVNANITGFKVESKGEGRSSLLILTSIKNWHQDIFPLCIKETPGCVP